VIKGTLEELLQSASLDTLRDDYIIAELSDRGPVVDAHSKLRRLYPALLHVSRSGGFEAEGLPSLAEQVKEKETVTELELLSDFFKDTTGEALTTAEQDIVIEILRELEAVL
jgi:exonuclease SbcD